MRDREQMIQAAADALPATFAPIRRRGMAVACVDAILALPPVVTDEGSMESPFPHTSHNDIAERLRLEAYVQKLEAERAVDPVYAAAREVIASYDLNARPSFQSLDHLRAALEAAQKL